MKHFLFTFNLQISSIEIRISVVKMRNWWNLGASAALNPKRRWFGWTPAMSGRGWEKEKINRILENRRDDALRKDTPRPKQF